MARRYSLGLAAVCGAGYGSALARWLFESQPQALAAFATWPGVLGAAGVCALAAAWLAHRFAAQPFASLALLLPLISVLSPDVNVLRSQTLLLGSFALFVMLTLRAAKSFEPLGDSAWRFLAPFLLFLSLFSLYVITVSPVAGEADAFEFQVNVARLGVSHGNGYPLLILVGKVFERLPLGGTQAWRVNLSAAMAAAVAAVGVFALARRLGVATLPAWLAALTFGVAPSVWARAVEIEAYALNAALMTALLLLGLRLIRESEVTSQKKEWPLYALAFVFGLSLTNHLTSAMLVPALAFVGLIWLWRVARVAPTASRFTFRALLLACLCFLLGLSIYLYLPLRWPAINNGELLSLSQFGYFLRGGEAAGQFDALLPLKEPQRFSYVFRRITGEFGWPGFALMGVGLVVMGLRGLREIRDKKARGEMGRSVSLVAFVFLLLAYLGHAYFVLAYDPPEPDFSDFFISTYVVAAVWIAIGLHVMRNRLLVAGISQSLLPAVFSLLPLSLIWTTRPRFDYAAAQQRYEVGQYTLRQPLAQHAALLADPKRFAAPYYLQQAEGMRPDLDIVVLPDEASYRASLDERIAAGQTVYLARYLAGLGSGYSLRSTGPVAEVSPQPFLVADEPANVLEAAMPGGIRLIGYDLALLDRALRLTLYWQAPGTAASESLAVYLRLRRDDADAWRNTGSVPVAGLYPTNAWRAGEYIRDTHAIPLAAGLPPGQYALEAALFPPFRPDFDAQWTELATIATEPHTFNVAIPQPLRARFGEQWLLGYDAPESALPGSPVKVTLFWLREAWNSVTAFGETRSLAGWPAGAIVPVEYELRAPASGEAFAPSVATGAPARCGWLAGETAACSLRPIRLTGESLPPDAVSFNGQLVLRRATLETPQVTRGESVKVALEWQALQSMAESYTVFVHLVGPDGALYGQRDYWPVEGTRLTSSWLPGEVIADPYSVPLPADAPPGAYTVHIGLYLLDTLERLPVLNADSQPIDDKVILTGLVVE
jgi:hypothetical protein